MASSTFNQQVYDVVRLIPKGRVMSYGGVARQCGQPGRARGVGYALYGLPDPVHVPWWRVVNSSGRISIPNPDTAAMQRDLLRAEGVDVSDDLTLDIRAYDAEMTVYKKLQRRSKREHQEQGS
jgi:methylated-DNA-protein-cysteine methyltransferase-like protein